MRLARWGMTSIGHVDDIASRRVVTPALESRQPTAGARDPAGLEDPVFIRRRAVVSPRSPRPFSALAHLEKLRPFASSRSGW